MDHLATIEIRKQYLHFSAAHFTIFSATERERLHGHNWQVGALISGPIGKDGLCFDYAIFKKLLKDLCGRFDEYMLLPEFSPHLRISEEGDNYRVEHNQQDMYFLKQDTLILPVANITIEEMARYLLAELRQHQALIDQHNIGRLQLEVSSGPDQWASSAWERA